MKHPHLLRLWPLLPCALIGFLAGCDVVPPAQDDPTRYFILSDPAVRAAQAPVAGALRLGLRPVQVESYLKKKQMVVRTGANEVEFKDYRRWAEPLDAAIARVLRASLLASPGVAQVQAEPFPFDQQRDFDVSIEVRRFEGAVVSGRFVASFSATVEIWTVGTDAHLVARKQFTAPDSAWDGKDYDQLASLLSADVSALGQEVVADLPAKG